MEHIASRRLFLKTAACRVGNLLTLPSARTAYAYRANERLRLAVVGMAGYGACDGFTVGLHTLGNVGYTASCDVDQRKVQKVYDFWASRVAESGEPSWSGKPGASRRPPRVAWYFCTPPDLAQAGEWDTVSNSCNKRTRTATMFRSSSLR